MSAATAGRKAAVTDNQIPAYCNRPDMQVPRINDAKNLRPMFEAAFRRLRDGCHPQHQATRYAASSVTSIGASQGIESSPLITGVGVPLRALVEILWPNMKGEAEIRQRMGLVRQLFTQPGFDWLIVKDVDEATGEYTEHIVGLDGPNGQRYMSQAEFRKMGADLRAVMTAGSGEMGIPTAKAAEKFGESAPVAK